jgi:hypothetical protein
MKGSRKGAKRRDTTWHFPLRSLRFFAPLRETRLCVNPPPKNLIKLSVTIEN